MAAQKKPKQINLLPREQFAASTTGRVLAWTLSTFRIIVIVTELLVMAAFLSRFWLDAKASDLNEDIAQKEAVIQSTAEFEKEFRKVQKQLSIFQTLSAQENSPPDVLQAVSQYLPSDVSLTSFTFTTQEARVKGVSPTERAIAQFVENLRASEEFESVTLTQLDSL